MKISLLFPAAALFIASAAHAAEPQAQAHFRAPADFAPVDAIYAVVPALHGSMLQVLVSDSPNLCEDMAQFTYRMGRRYLWIEVKHQVDATNSEAVGVGDYDLATDQDFVEAQAGAQIATESGYQLNSQCTAEPAGFGGDVGSFSIDEMDSAQGVLQAAIWKRPHTRSSKAGRTNGRFRAIRCPAFEKAMWERPNHALLCD